VQQEEPTMFESAEVGHTLDKASYEKEVPGLREALLNAQYDLHLDGRFPVVVLLAGLGGGGRSETANLLNEWMDPRHIQTRAFGRRNDLERERPPMWRYWQALPPKGTIGVLMGAWYHDLLLGHAAGRYDEGEVELALHGIRRFEQMLCDEGALLLKVWFHLSRAGQKQRLRELLDNRRTRWRVTPDDLEQLKLYNRYRGVSEHVLRETSTGGAPWTVIEATDPHYRDVTVGRLLLESVRRRIDDKTDRSRAPGGAPGVSLADNVRLLRDLDLSKKLERKLYQKELAKLQDRFWTLIRRKKFARRSMVVVFEGQDAAGKGSSIRRVVWALDARQYRIVPIAAPTEEERAQPYLWRFWRRLPGHGEMTIFDRSWYGRVLVERVEGFASEAAWMRAYDEINAFEGQLVRNGAVVVKFWLQISQEEQLRRFQAREDTPFKRFKITAEDWRNREKWDAYEVAVCDMIDRTSTEIAPWTIVEAEDKYYGRVKVLRTLVEALDGAL
jgi:polyphosphate:AMP phosphotransferase